MMNTLFTRDMMKKIFCQGYLWLLLLLLYSPILIIVIFSFTEARVMGNWTGFSLQLYKNLFVEGTHQYNHHRTDHRHRIYDFRNPHRHRNLQSEKPVCEKRHPVRQQYPDSERRHHHRYIALPTLHHAGHSAGLHHGGSLSHHLLSALRHPECDA